MYKINFYEDENGNNSIAEYIEHLAQRKDKDSRIKLNKIRDYIKILSEYGTKAGEPYIKHIDGEIWELRPLRDRIFFVCWSNGGFVLLHYFVKKTQKTPLKEIKKAKLEFENMKERRIKYE